MKLIFSILSLFLIGACARSPEPTSLGEKIPVNPKVVSQNAVPVPADEVLDANQEYELFLGVHNIEYFADRMVLKSKRAGYNFAHKKTLHEKGQILYQVTLGPFKSKAEAQIAEQKIKALTTPELTISRVRAVNSPDHKLPNLQ